MCVQVLQNACQISTAAIAPVNACLAMLERTVQRVSDHCLWSGTRHRYAYIRIVMSYH